MNHSSDGGEDAALCRSCERCTARKRKCCGAQPVCLNCRRAGAECTYVVKQKTGRKRKPEYRDSRYDTSADGTQVLSVSTGVTLPEASLAALATHQERAFRLKKVLTMASAQVEDIHPGFSFVTESASVFWEVASSFDPATLALDRCPPVEVEGLLGLLYHLFLFSGGSALLKDGETAEAMGAKAMALLKILCAHQRSAKGAIVEQIFMAAVSCLVLQDDDCGSTTIRLNKERLYDFVESLLTRDGAGSAHGLRPMVTMMRMHGTDMCVPAVWDGWFLTVSLWQSGAAQKNTRFEQLRDLSMAYAVLFFNLFKLGSNAPPNPPLDKNDPHHKFYESKVWLDTPGSVAKDSWEYTALRRLELVLLSTADTIKTTPREQVGDRHLDDLSALLLSTHAYTALRLGDLPAAGASAQAAATILVRTEFKPCDKWVFNLALAVLVRTDRATFHELYGHAAGGMEGRDKALACRLLDAADDAGLRDGAGAPVGAAGVRDSAAASPTATANGPVAAGSDNEGGLVLTGSCPGEDGSAYQTLFIGDVLMPVFDVDWLLEP